MIIASGLINDHINISDWLKVTLKDSEFWEAGIEKGIVSGEYGLPRWY